MVFIKQAICFFWFSVALPAVAIEQVVMDFSLPDLKNFKQKNFSGKTSYSTVKLQGKTVLKAVTNRSASALYRELEIDLHRTPYLTWRWQIKHNYAIKDQTIKEGDDYPARVYVVIRTGIFPWQTRALNYVWSNTAIEEPYWPNPFTEKAIMIPLRSNADELGRWQQERVNVAEDYFRVFGERIQTIHGIAIMSDSDNNGGYAVAYYDTIRFSN